MHSHPHPLKGITNFKGRNSCKINVNKLISDWTQYIKDLHIGVWEQLNLTRLALENIFTY